MNQQQNPWAGLSSYQDPETTKRPLKFCGRDNETFDMARLIDDNIFVTLYGKSGTGKTSLLNAGVFPRLRQEQYLPVSIRLGMDAMDTTFQQCIVTHLQQAIAAKGTATTTDVVPLPASDQSTEYLWSYFARTRFADHDGRTLFPVIVLDQFEEVFRNRRPDAEALLRQIDFMQDESHALTDRIINGQPWQYDFNFRFVVSIREDDLYRLEDSIDNCYLPAMKRCRYRLQSLSEQGARDAILTPGEGLFEAAEQEDIVNTILRTARNTEDQTISTNLLSLVCSRIFVDYQRTGATSITSSLVDNFVKGNPFERFYNEATRGFSNREKSYIEEHLVDSTGRRNSVPESDFLLHVKRGTTLLEGNTRILQRISTSSDGSSYRIELIHDSFCAPLATLKEKREKRKRMMWLASAAATALLCMGVTAFIAYQISRIQQQEGTIAQQDETLQSQNALLEQQNLLLGQEKTKLVETLTQLEEKNKQLEDINKQLERERTELRVTKQELVSRNQELEITISQLNAEERARKQLEQRIERITPATYTFDGIEYTTDSPTDSVIDEWKNKYHDVCKGKISGQTDSYSNVQRLIKEEPCLVYLILNAKSLSNHEDRQEWFNLWHLMNESQVGRLYDILYRENYKRAAINFKDKIKEYHIKAHNYANNGDFQQAIDNIDKAISEVRLTYANVLDSKGEILLMRGNENEQEAFSLWKKLIEIAPDFLDYYNNTPLHKRLKELGLLNE